ncbi:TIGR02530 family flagellar biosynthesis protein [Terrilactibacillus sp. S3-3]|nr:TIGR02530 family flagellar biosynthesis protein [Terrilactibacillus sp. S3-3]
MNDSSQSASFKQLLNSELDQAPVTISKHAKQRLVDRHINISPVKWEQIHQKMQEASKMGISDSLVLTKEAALVVNAHKNTVITAMNLKEAKTHIFTNINGTIVLND